MILEVISWKIIITFLVTIGYYLYYLKYRHYKWVQKEDIRETRNFRGKSLPCFPNGWFKLVNSEDLKVEEVKYMDYCGRNLALYRGKDGKAYALEAYCAHMGANMALGGAVKLGKGLQCPFHGWIYDGDTGNCVVDSKMESRTGDVYDYHNKETCEKKDGSVLKKDCNSTISVKRYVVREIKGQILVWFHSDDKLREKPQYEPLVWEHGLDYRGESLNFVNTHIQDIPENGADLKHFFYVHNRAIPGWDLIKFKWNLRWCRGDDPEICEKLKIEHKGRNAFRQEVLKKYITEENKQYLSVLALENTICMFGFEIKLFDLTAFQMGPGLVYMVLDSPFFRAGFQQAVTPTEKYMQNLWHRIYTKSWLPYWVSAVFLKGEVTQVLGDLRIWNNKKYTPKLTYDMSTKADQYLYNWRSWYGQFYEGCAEHEKQLNKLDW